MAWKHLAYQANKAAVALIVNYPPLPVVHYEYQYNALRIGFKEDKELEPENGVNGPFFIFLIQL